MLEESERAVMLLALQGLGVNEIATTLGVSRRVVSQRRSRALKALRKALRTVEELKESEPNTRMGG